MKTLLAAAFLALAASQANAAPVSHVAAGWYQGSWTCTIAHAPKLKLFMTLNTHLGRAAVREYPFYGKTEYKTLVRAGGTSFTSVSFHGAQSFLSLRRSSPGVLTGTGRIGTTIMLLTCARG